MDTGTVVLVFGGIMFVTLIAIALCAFTFAAATRKS